MSKIIGIVFISLMFANIGYAEIRLIESETNGADHSERYLLSTVCIDGYKFVVVKSGKVHSMSMSMVQFMEDFNNAAVPAEC